MGAGGVEWGEADFVDEDEVGFEDVFDDPADAVVGQAAVEGVDQFGGAEVADPASGGDGVVAQGDQQVTLAGAGRADQTKVLFGRDPFEAG